jgi:hypothetical protein
MIEELIYATVVMASWSLLYKSNPIYRVMESAFVGITLAYNLYEGLKTLNNRVFTPVFIKGEYATTATVMLILGIMVYTRFFTSTRPISRLPIALMSGVGTAIAVKGAVGAMILKQAAIGPIIGVDWWTATNNILMVTATLTTFCYFFYTIRYTTWLRGLARIGRFFMMISFGCTLAGFTYGAGTSITGFSFYLTSYPGVYIFILGCIMLIGYAYWQSTQG